MLYDEIPSSWRFVSNPDHLVGAVPACDNCGQEKHPIPSTTNLLPSFIWSSETQPFYTPITFDLIAIDGVSADIDMSAEIANMVCFVIGARTYITLNVQEYTSMTTPLTTGVFRAEISDGLTTLYSEPIEFCEDEQRCVEMRWSNTCDIADIPYDYLNTTSPFYNIAIFKDSPIIPPTFETEREEFENMSRRKYPFYVDQEREFSFETKPVPAWLTRSMQVMQLHDDIKIKYKVNGNYNDGLYSADILRATVISSPVEGNVCDNELEVRFTQDDNIGGTQCCVASEPDGCLAPCFNVDGFKDDFVGSYVLNHYYIDDVDSPVIYIYNGTILVVATTTCTYLYNEDIDQYMFFDGDQWNETPRINLIISTGHGGGSRNFTLTGYTMPGTWVYLYWSVTSPSGPFTQIMTPLTPAQLQAGFNFTIPSEFPPAYYFKLFSVNHQCQYNSTAVYSVST